MKTEIVKLFIVTDQETMKRLRVKDMESRYVEYSGWTRKQEENESSV